MSPGINSHYSMDSFWVVWHSGKPPKLVWVMASLWRSWRQICRFLVEEQTISFIFLSNWIPDAQIKFVVLINVDRDESIDSRGDFFLLI